MTTETKAPYQAWVNANPPGPAEREDAATLPEARAALKRMLANHPDAEVLVGDVQKWEPELGDYYDLDGDEEACTSCGELLWVGKHTETEIAAKHEGAHEFTPEVAVLFPDLEVELLGTDSNAMAVVAAVSKALRRYRVDGQRAVTPAQVDAFRKEALAGDYDNVLATCMRWVDVS